MITRQNLITCQFSQSSYVWQGRGLWPAAVEGRYSELSGRRGGRGDTSRDMTLSHFICSDSGDRRERSVCEAGEGAAGVTCAELKRISKIKAFPKPDKPVCIWSFATLGL